MVNGIYESCQTLKDKDKEKKLVKDYKREHERDFNYHAGKGWQKMEFNREQREHEHNITAELYRQLKNMGAEVYMSHRVIGAEFDLVLVKDDKIVLIFEVKKNKDSYRHSGAQVARYFQYNVPIVLVVSSEMVPEAVAVSKRVLNGENLLNQVTRLVPVG